MPHFSAAPINGLSYLCKHSHDALHWDFVSLKVESFEHITLKVKGYLILVHQSMSCQMSASILLHGRSMELLSSSNMLSTVFLKRHFADRTDRCVIGSGCSARGATFADGSLSQRTLYKQLKGPRASSTGVYQRYHIQIAQTEV